MLSSPTKPPPSPADPLLDEAVALARQGKLAEAEEACTQACALATGSARVDAVDGFLRAARGKLDEALAAFERAIEKAPHYLIAHRYRAALLEGSGRFAEALSAFERVVALDPAQIDARARCVILLAELGRGEAALEAAAAARALFPEELSLQIVEGLALRRAGRLEQALAIQEAVLERAPELAVAWGEKGAVLQAMGRFEAALEAYDESLEHDERHLFSLNGMGLVELELGMVDAAAAAFAKVLELQPGNAEALFYQAMTLERRGRVAEAARGYEQALERKPAFPEALSNLGKIHRERGDLEQALALFRRALAINPELHHVRSNLLCTLLYDPSQSVAALAAEHRAFGARLEGIPGRYTSWPNDRRGDRPLAVGIVSAELCRHALNAWLLPSLAQLPRAGFELIFYATSGPDDAIRAQHRALATRWRDVRGIDDQRLAAMIREDGIDILIETSGHTANNRLSMLALKPAPVQVSWPGYPFTTGLDAIDEVIMDPIALPPGDEGAFVEHVVRLPRSRVCYAPPADAPAPRVPPVARTGWVTYGSFNTVVKLNDLVLETWCRILRERPAARLILKATSFADPETRERFNEAFRARGIPQGRIELRPPSIYAEMLAQYHDVDIALDPFPFGGGATSGDALWMGVPVVTLSGPHPGSRQTSIYLDAIGKTEWVASTPDEYVRIAVQLAADPLALIDMRAKQREALMRSPICDQAAFGGQLAAALTGMWRRFAASPLEP